MFAIHIQMPPVDIHIHADRRLAFQVITAFGASTQVSGASSRVIEREDNRLLVEFRTPIRGLFGRRKVYRTVEWVTLNEPESVEFEGVEGPLPYLHDCFTLEDEMGCTRFRYESEFGAWGWWAGWLLGMLYVRPRLRRFMREHVEQMKQTIEERARKSRMFPQTPCPWEEASR